MHRGESAPPTPLWICRQNIGRSIVAQALYEEIYETPCFSAGLIVDDLERPLVGDCEEADLLIKFMIDEYSIDISDRPRTPVAKYYDPEHGIERMDEFDRVSTLLEQETLLLPEYQWLFNQREPYTYHTFIFDLKARDHEKTRYIVNKIIEEVCYVGDTLLK